MSEGKHAPTPWEAVYLGKTTWAVRSRGGLQTLVVFKTIDREWNKSHAEFMVKACNSYEQDQETIKALVKACEGAMRISKLWQVDPEINLENPSEGQALDAMSQQIEAALALAKKKGERL